MSDDSERVEAIFWEALGRDATRRKAFLDEACAGQGRLRQQVEDLLRGHEAAGDFLERSALAWVAELARGEAEPVRRPPPSAQGIARPSPSRTGAPEPGRLAQDGDDGPRLDFLGPSPRPGVLGRLDHYDVLEVVGRGGMGLVLRAFDEALQRVVAIKVLAPAWAAGPVARRRFIREARAAAAVNHDRVVAIHAVVADAEVPYLVMPYVAGRSLQQKLDNEGALELREILRIGMQTAEGLAAAHRQGLVHRDIKPANILLEDGDESVKITDFGLAHAVDDTDHTQNGVVIGTPAYMSPEQAGGLPVDRRSDLFSLGSVLHALCTGRPPFRAETTLAVLRCVAEEAPPPIRDLRPDMPAWLGALIAHLHAKAPAERFPSAAGVAETLARHLAELRHAAPVDPTPARPRPAQEPGPAPPPARRPGWTRPGWGTRAAVGVLLAVGLVAVLPTLLSGDRPAVSGRTGRDDPRPGAGQSAQPRKQALGFAPPSGPRRWSGAGEPAQPPKPGDEASRPEVAAGLSPARIPRSLLAVAGGGDPDRATPDLVALLGDDRFRMPRDEATGYPAYRPDGRVLAVPSILGVLLYDPASGQLLRVVSGPTGAVTAVVFSQAGDVLAGATRDGTVGLWDTRTWAPLRTLSGHTGDVQAVALSPDGTTLISSGWDKTVRVWDVDSGQPRYVLSDHTAPVCTVAVSPGGTMLATGGMDKTVALHDLATGRLLHQLPGHTDFVYWTAFTPDGTTLISAANAEIKSWDVRTGREIFSTRYPHPAGWSGNLVFTPEGRPCLVRLEQETDSPGKVLVRIWEPASGKERAALSLRLPGSWHYVTPSPDGTVLVIASVGGRVVRLVDVATGKERFPRHGHAGPVLSLAVSPDGRRLASGGSDQSVRVWDLATREEVWVTARHDAPVGSVAFSPDGTLVASADHAGAIILSRAADGAEVRRLIGSPLTAPCLAFSRDGRALAAGGEDGRIRSWDVADGREREPLRWHTGEVRAVAFSPDGTRLATAGADGAIHCGEWATGKCLQDFSIDAPAGLLAFTPDGRTLACVRDLPDGGLHLWDLASEEEDVPAILASSPLGLAIHPGGHLIAAGAADGLVRIWHRIAAGSPVLTVAPGPRDEPVRQLTFTPDGRHLVVAGDSGLIAILRTPGDPPARPPGPRRRVPTLARLAAQPSPADDLSLEAIPPVLLTAAGDGNARNAPPALVAVLGGMQGHTGPVLAVALSPDGAVLASAGQDSTVRLWALKTGALMYTLSGHAGCVRGLAFAPDGRTLASAGHDGTVKLWDRHTGRERAALSGHGAPVTAVAFAPDGQALAAALDDGSIRLWDVPRRVPIRSLLPARRTEWTSGLAFGAEGTLLASGARDGLVRLWDVETGWELDGLPGHADLVLGLALRPDGEVVASGGADRTVRCWDLARGRATLLLEGHRGRVGGIAWHPGSRFLASGSLDGTVRLWNTDLAPARSREIRLFAPDRFGVNGLAFTAEGRHLVTANSDGTIYVLRLARPGEVLRLPDN